MPPCRLTDLPDELRLHCVRGLPAKDLASASQTCVTMHDDISRDDICWRLCCRPFFAAATSTVSPTAKDCYLSANGWAKIQNVPRNTIAAATISSSRSRNTRTHCLAQISAWDADGDDCLYFSTEPSDGMRPLLMVAKFDDRGLEDQRESLELIDAPSAADEPRGSSYRPCRVSDIVRLQSSSAHPERALIMCHHHSPHGTSAAVHALRSATAGGDQLQVVPLWTLPNRMEFGQYIPNRLAWQGGTGAADDAAPPLDHLIAWGSGEAHVCDARTGVAITYRQAPAQTHLEDLCFSDPTGSPQLIAMAAQGGSYDSGAIVLHDLRVPEQGGGAAQVSFHTPHRLICRLRPGPDPNVLLSAHKICKDVQRWDLRREPTIARTPIGGTAYRTFAHCAGNGPDFEYAQSTLVCLSRGSPGTTFGAKLQVFAKRPRRISNVAGAILPEIVIDTFNRHAYARSLRLGTRTLTLLADGERFIRCTMPPSGA